MGQLYYMRFIPCLCAAIGFLSQAQAAEDQFSPPSQAEFAKNLGGEEVFQILKTASHVDAIRVRVDEKHREKTIPIGEVFELSETEAKQAKTIFADRNSYFNGGSACIFDPGVKLTFRKDDGDVVELLVCLHCADVEVLRKGKQVGFASVARSHEKVILFAQSLFPKDKAINGLIEERATTKKKGEDDDARWLAGMPKSLRPIWNPNEFFNPKSYLSPYRIALAKEFPDEKARILALLHWFGSGAGPRSGFPAYETTAEELLLEYPTATILTVVESTTLDNAQIEGTARLLGGWDFNHRRPDDNKLIPKPLKKTLLEHALKDSDEDKQARAKNAFR